MSKWNKFDFTNNKTWPVSCKKVLFVNTDIRIPLYGCVHYPINNAPFIEVHLLGQDGLFKMPSDKINRITHWQELPAMPEKENA